MDKVKIENFEVMCRIGVTEKERSKEQKIFIDAEFFVDSRKAGISDDINDTINYSIAFEIISSIAKEEFRLIEALAEHTTKALLDALPVNEVAVKVKKPLPSKGCQYASVEIARAKK